MKFSDYNSELGQDPNPPTQPIRVRDDDKTYNWLKTQKGLGLELTSRKSFINTMKSINDNSSK
jgi:hypothetical protein